MCKNMYPILLHNVHIMISMTVNYFHAATRARARSYDIIQLYLRTEKQETYIIVHVSLSGNIRTLAESDRIENVKKRARGNSFIVQRDVADASTRLRNCYSATTRAVVSESVQKITV